MDDTATYECTVTNGAGDDKRTVDLTVQGRTGWEHGLKDDNTILHHSNTLQEGSLFFPF